MSIAVHKLIQILILLSFILVSYQNCSGPIQFSSHSPPIFKTESENNGYGYEGKPDGNYYHFVPEFNCEGKERAVGEIVIKGSQISYTKSLSVQCAATTQDLTFAQLDFSPFETQLIGFEDKIFERKDELVEKIPDRLTEAWCFDDPSQKKFEVIHRYDSQEKSVTSEVLYRNEVGNRTSVLPLGVSRVVAISTVLYQGPNYQLLIDKENRSAIPGQYVGKFSAVIDSKPIEKNLSCRLGGYLDARLWPAKLLIDGDITQFELDSNLENVYAVIRKTLSLSNTKSFLVERNLAVNLPRVLTPRNPALMGVNDFLLDSLGIVYRADELAEGAFRLFSLDLITGQSSAVGVPIPRTEQSVGEGYTRTKGGLILYKDGTQDPGMDVEKWLWVSKVGAVKPLQLNLDLPLDWDAEVYSYFYSEDLNKVVYASTALPLTEGPSGRLISWSVINLDGSDRKQISPYTDQNLNYWPWNPAQLVGPKKEYLLYLVDKGVPPSKIEKSMLVSALDGSGSIDLNLPSTKSATTTSSPNGASFILQAIAAPSAQDTTYLVQAGSWKKINLPTMNSVHFSMDSKKLFGLSGRTFYAFNAISGTQDANCQLQGNASSLTVASTSVAFFTEDNPLGGSTRLYKYNKGECEIVNEIPIRSLAPPSIKISANERQALLLASPNKVGLNELYWLPLDGRAGIKVSVPVTQSAQVKMALFTKDSRSIIYFGNQIEPAEQQLFIWPLPLP